MDEMRLFTKDDFEILAARYVVVECSLVPSRKLLLVERIYEDRARMSVGKQDGGGYYEDVYEFSSVQRALIALFLWDPDKQEEPGGWDRHPDSGRNRIQGRSDLEFVYYTNDNVLQHVIHAVVVTCRKDGILMGIKERSEHIGGVLPSGTRCFYILAKFVLENRKEELLVYHYGDHTVVMGLEQSKHIMLSEVIQRLGDG
jgi:hypothetical protein